VKVASVHYLSLQDVAYGQAAHAHVHEIMVGLRRCGWEVKLFAPHYGPGRSPGLAARIWQLIWTQMRIWVRGRPDLLYVRFHFASWPTCLWARLRRIPVVQEVNGTYEDLFIAWPVARRARRVLVGLMRSQLRMASGVICVTHGLADWVRREVGQDLRLAVVPNGVNTVMFHPDAPVDASLELPGRYVLFFGALAPWQGLNVLLAAVERQEWPDGVQLVVVGDGVKRSCVVTAARRCRRIHYLGPQPYKRMPGIVARAMASVSPQVHPRGSTGLMPLKLLESLACGVPVIVTDYPDMADLVRQARCGIVVPPGSAEELARAVAQLDADPVERSAMGKRGCLLAHREHSWDCRAARTAAFLQQVLASILPPGGSGHFPK